MTPAREDFPESLLATDQWLCWDERIRDGDTTKVPIDPTTGTFGSATDLDTWSDVDTALNAASDYSGLGFVFTDDDLFVGVDLDKCRDPDTGSPEDWSREVIIDLDSYTEVSPSGTGFHIIATGTLPDGGSRSGNVEMYETARFFTMTGDHVAGTPRSVEPREAALKAVHEEHIAESPSDEPGNESQQETSSTVSLDDAELVERARDAANGEKFSRLYQGSTAGYDSHSEADMALCSLLAFWTGNDAAQIDRLFRESGLCRPKWDEIHYADGSTYGEKTIERAIDGTADVYDPDPQEDTAAPATGTADRAVTPQRASPQTATTADPHRIEAMETTLEQLEGQVQSLQDTVDQLQETLVQERRQRRALEKQLAVLRETTDQDTEGTSWWRRRSE